MGSIILYLSSIILANILVHTFGIITVLGLTFPAGAVMIGLTFSFRDILQQRHGKWGCWVWMFAALIITFFFNKNIAFASMSAFLISEFVDWSIFTYSKRPFNQRIMLSNLVGTPIDSVVFVVLAFGFNWQAIWGQTIIKFVSSLVVVGFNFIKPKFAEI